NPKPSTHPRRRPHRRHLLRRRSASRAALDARACARLLGRGRGVWGITRYDDLLAIAKDSQAWRSGGGIRPDAWVMPYMIDMDDPDHRKRRALVNKGFTPRRGLEREPRIPGISIDLIPRPKAPGRVDFVHHVAASPPPRL